MVLWRKKRSAIARHWRRVVGYDAAVGLISYGAANIKPTGRGEQAVPTTGMFKTLVKLLQQWRYEGCGWRAELVDECNSTRKCHVCTRVMRQQRDEHGNYVRGVMLCGSATCRQPDHSPTPRDRDANAAINILVAAEAMARGEPRPAYLCRDPPRRRRRAP